MLYKRSIAVAAAFVFAVVFPSAAAASANASAIVRGGVPWTDQTVFALSPTYSYVAEWMGYSTGWIEIGGPATQLYAGSAGVFELDSSGNIWMYNGTPFSWTEIGGPGSEFAEGGGHLYGLGPNDNYVAEWNGTPNSWTIIGGPASSIAAGADGLVATAPYGTTEDAWHYNGTPNNWTDISGPAGEFAVGVNTIYRLDENDSTISQWNGGTTWTPIYTVAAGGIILEMFAGGAGVFIGDEPNDAGPTTYRKYNGTPNSWSVIGGGRGFVPSPIVESSTSLFGVTDDSNFRVASVDIYSGSGTSWTVIGGPAAPNLAAGD